LQVLLRLTPLNPATISYLLGAAGVRFSGFLIGCLALTPNLVIEVYFGHVGKHAVHLVGSDARNVHLHDLAIIGGLAVCVAVMVLVSRIARKAVTQAVAEAEKAGGLPGGHRNDLQVISEHEYRVNLKAELEIRHLNEKIDHLIVQQWERLLEIQQIEMELMEELVPKNRRTR
jgi:hypothetical protein